MKTRDQRRQRRPLGSVFVGQAPQKWSLAGAASCLLPNTVAPLAEKGLPDAQQVYMPNMAKNIAKNCQKTHKFDRKSSKRHTIWPIRLFFRRFRPSPSF